VGDEIDVEVLDVDLDKERISLSLKATQADPWQQFADSHAVGQLVYGRITKLVPFGAFVQVGDGIEGLVHISEMAAHHVDLPEQVVSPGEELWVKIIDIDLQRRRISLSIKQAAEGGEVSEEYREAFGEHAYDAEGNYIGNYDYADAEFTPETEAQAAWADYVVENPGAAAANPDEATPVPTAPVAEAPVAPEAPRPRRRSRQRQQWRRRSRQRQQWRRPSSRLHPLKRSSRAPSSPDREPLTAPAGAGAVLRPSPPVTRREPGRSGRRGEVAGHQVAWRDLSQLGNLFGTARLCTRAAGAEAAARRGVDRARWLAFHRGRAHR